MTARYRINHKENIRKYRLFLGFLIHFEAIFRHEGAIFQPSFLFGIVAAHPEEIENQKNLQKISR